MLTECEIKMIETQSGLIQEKNIYWKTQWHNEEKLVWLFYIATQWIYQSYQDTWTVFEKIIESKCC